MENFDWGSFFLQVVICWVFYNIGQAAAIRKVSKTMIANLKKTGITVEANANGELVFSTYETLLEIERVGQQYFAYSDQGQFMGQGADFTSLFEGLKKQYPDHNFRISKDQSKLSDVEITQMIESIFKVFGDIPHANSHGR